MANVASAVSILTSHGQAGSAGLTVSSMASVTDTPATVLVCINQGSDLHDVIAENGHVAINLLQPEHEELALHFACMAGSTMAERLSWDVWGTGRHDVPILKNALAVLQGRVTHTHKVGTHSVFFIELDDITIAEHGDALVYHNRRFKALEH
ncbi:flavin reductase [Pasteurellaceae bacterium 20609_3]|uniref:flavin reductase n=1 Tax=Spirabiliibacterium mucosae TaxID=28156 RepID=UPI001AADE85F|nr:flavin reductase [Spirabiliibacterium mucosae]MBE2898261.1 flavin reductase [Spirabiliibacterium mucosae]